MRRRFAFGIVAIGLLMALTSPPGASAAADSDDTSFPVNAFDQLEVHTRLDCVKATASCSFSAAANLRNPDGVAIGFPADLWARQTTEMRSSDRHSYLETDVPDYGFQKLFKEGGSNVITTMWFGESAADRILVPGNIFPTSWIDGKPKTDADVIVCSHIQVVYSGVNITSPATCSQATFD